ncbi:MAG: hypothetical protein M0002_00775 [Rhodospirillales bacterium]|nr:hypothetical protein [Rhodospirillales bacterium]
MLKLLPNVPATEVTIQAGSANFKEKAKTKQGTMLTLSPPALSPEAVDGAALLDELSRFFAEHAFLPPGAADVLAVWATQTYCYYLFPHTPRLSITSPEKGSGKTTVLDLLERIVCKPMSVVNITPASVFRSIEKMKPTLLVDEADTFLTGKSELRGVLNAGHKFGGTSPGIARRGICT